MNNQPREVKFKTKLAIARRKPVFLILGIVFTLVSIHVIVIIGVIFSSLGSGVPAVDYDKVNTQGKSTSATITDIETQYNVTINNEHPSIIAYTYKKDNQPVASKFETLAADKVGRLKIGDSIDVKYVDNASIITTLPPYKVSSLFYLIPLAFLLVGIPFLLYAISRIRKEIYLYKYGNVSNAELISMESTKRSKHSLALTVYYQYNTTHNQKHLGESLTDDLSIQHTYKQGDTIKIFVSPEDERHSTLIPRLEAVRNNWKIDLI
jgi:hypothetical protein